MKPESVGFIGAGHIAEALIRGLVTSGYLDPGQIHVSDVMPQRLDLLHRRMGVRIAHDNASIAEESEVLFLSVKPQQVLGAADGIRHHLRSTTLVVSVAAGTLLGTIRKHLGGHRNLCRIMPNLASAVKKATIGLYADADTSTQELSGLYSLLGSFGRVFRLDDEGKMATVTALSGSAPAYYVMMADALIRYGVSQGLDEKLATEMILSTMEGSAIWAESSRQPLDELWREVVTAGGTTEAGIQHYEDRGFIDIFVEGLRRATDKARELAEQT